MNIQHIAAMMGSYRVQRHLVPKGVWLLLLVYCLVAFGSPMPPRITWLEIVMGCGLLMGGIALAGNVMCVILQQRSSTCCLALVLFLFFIPLCIGLLHGNGLTDILRDVCPLAFLLLIPILLVYSASLSNLEAMSTLMTTVLVFVGICSAVLFFIGTHNLYGSIDKFQSGMRIGMVQLSEVTQVTQAGLATQAIKVIQPVQLIDQSNEIKRLTLLLKPFDPAVLFTAIFLSTWGVIMMVRSWLGWLPGMLLVITGSAIAYEFMIMGLRAYTAFFILGTFAICLTQYRNRGLYIRFLPVVFMACMVLWPKIEAVVQIILTKQHAAGWMNGKSGEWLAVISTLHANPYTWLFGVGWGGVIENPIYGGTTRFTHSILSFFLLKAGVIGLGMLLTIVGLLLKRSIGIGDAIRFDISSKILLFSSLPPLLIGVMFEPTYKMLSYGVILALLILSLPRMWTKAYRAE